MPEEDHPTTYVADRPIDFLRQVDRTRLLVHLVDPMGFSGKGPLEEIKVIDDELKAWNPKLAAKPRILAVNKMDLPGAREVFRRVQTRRKASRPLAVSAATGEGVPALLDRIILELSLHPAEGPSQAPFEKQVRMEAGFTIQRHGAVFILRGSFVERAAAMLESTLPEAVERFQRSLKRIGVDRALRRAGIQAGDPVRCGSFEFEWSEEAARPLPRMRRVRRTRVAYGKK